MGELYVFERGEPTDLVNFGGVQALPLALGSIVAALSAVTLAHVLVTAIRRRRRDLAVLKALGFTRRPVGLTVQSQATTLVTLAAVVGLPLGLALGRWAWMLLANQLGVVVEVVVPVALLILVVPGAVLLGNLIAALPARPQVARSRARPQDRLRSAPSRAPL